MLLAPSKTSCLPGIAACALATVAALAVNRFVPGLSPATAAVALGAALAGAGVIRASLRPGLLFVSRRVLRVAIVLLGLQIAVPQVLALGWQALAVVAVATGLTFVLTPLAGRRLGLSPGTSLLVATGVSICGAAAIAAMHDSADSSDEDAAGALSVVVLYGSAAIVVLPLLASWLGLSREQLGVWAGAAVHEVAQVAAIGAAGGVLATAVTVKLARVVLLAPIVAITTSRHRPRRTPARPAAAASGSTAAPNLTAVVVPGSTMVAAPSSTAVAAPVRPVAGASARPVTDGPAWAVVGGAAEQGAALARAVTPSAAAPGKRPPIVPLFVAGFLAMVAVRSTGLLPTAVTGNVPAVTNALMAAALFALGAGIDLRKLLKGGRVMLLGGIATGLIATISLVGVWLLG
ncbi:YeiH family protein [Nonomuraea jabiensis]|uniref:Putative membrane protein YadS n=1 Tax=Nonomuraea jabiensis TaxID=882448 RepID=A0A7W9GFQ0_9ACTN|nr:putative sulfate exporter family transporter [Nonomuraea jabiensis]MBB5782949.1 putative membrane protein YadS [Nonomuraea jabiensis]